MQSILVIDNEDLIRDFICKELEIAGYNTVQASNGRIGLELIQNSKPDLVLCDVLMPEMDGYELLEQVRGHGPDLADMPFLLMTCLSDRNEIIAGKNLGADDYITKPVDIEHLLATVNSRLSQISRISKQKQYELDNLRRSVLRVLPHEMRTPINSILGFSEVIKNRMLGDNAGDRYQEYAANIHDNAQQMMKMVDGAIDLIAITTGAVVPVLEPTACESIIRKAVEQADKASNNYNVAPDIVIEVAHGLPQIYADSNLVLRILCELIDNACKFAPPQNGEVVVSASHNTTENQLVIIVSDNGPGIDAPKLSDAMEIFSKIDGDTDNPGSQQPGFGLGLARAQALAGVLGTKIELQSTLGVGTTAIIGFPVKPQQKAKE